MRFLKNENENPTVYLEYDMQIEEVIDKINKLLPQYGINYEIIFEKDSDGEIFMIEQ